MQNTHSEYNVEGMYVSITGELVFVLLTEGREGIYPVIGIEEIGTNICLQLQG